MTSKLAPMIPVVPAYATAGILAFFQHLLVAFLHLLGLGKEAPAKGSLRRLSDGSMVLGQTCRCLFYLLWNNYVAADARVLVSPFHHHSFKRMMTKTGQKLDACGIDGVKLLPPKGKTGKDYDVVVVTHLLGRDYDFAWIKEWRRENPNIFVIEDRVQAGLITDEDPTLADVALYSTGQDKLPNFMGGGFAICHSAARPELAAELEALVQALPQETAWERCSFLLKKIPTVLIYNWRPATRIIEFMARTAGLSRCAVVDKYRKQNPGFMHAGFLIRPSNALLQSMAEVEDFSPWVQLQQRCSDTYLDFLHMIPDDLRETVKPCGADTSCTYFFIRLPDLDKGREFMAEHGIMTISNQTYLPIHAPDQRHIDNWVTTPWLPALTKKELQFVADITADTWAKFGGKRL